MVQESKKHHYIPIFYLRRWRGEGGKICTVRNFDGRIVKKYHAASHIGFENLLYSYDSKFDAKDRSDIETNFFQNLDSKAAIVLDKILKSEEVSHEEIVIWCQFLASMKARVPSVVEIIKKGYKDALIEELKDAQGEYEIKKWIMIQIRLLIGCQLIVPG